MNNAKTVLSCCIVLSTLNTGLGQLQLNSPDKRLEAEIRIDTQISIHISLNGDSLVTLSPVSMEMGEGRILGRTPELNDYKLSFHEGEIIPAIPIRDAKITDRYHELQMHFEGNYHLLLRAYDEGLAYRFVDDKKETSIVVNEDLTMTFPNHANTYFPQETSMYSHNERTYLYKTVSEILTGDFASLPVMFEVNGTKLVFTEASLHNYPCAFLQSNGDGSFTSIFPRYVNKAVPSQRGPDRNQTIVETADYIAKITGERSYPWRVLIISDDDRTFLETNLIEQLSGTSKILDGSWIKPGKVAWDWYNANNIFGVDFRAGINTETYRYYIDFASENGIEYVILDEGWTKSTTEIMEDHENINVHELIEYAKSRNVGIILWVLWKPLSEHVDEILKLYSSWGAKGIKVDFMQRSDQAMVSSYEEIAEVAAKYRLMVDFHGAFKPAGIERVWPNIVNYEGVKGNEWNKWSSDITPDHNLTIPFIRMVAGPIDFTPGSMINTNQENFKIRFERPMSMGTRCHQVAMYVIYEAPLQMMCESPSIYRKEQETVDFITQIPTTWDETIVLEAAISDYVVLARRKGENWYISAMTDWTPRTFNIGLSFLQEGNYKMEVMKDGVNADRYAEDYKKVTVEVNRDSEINLNLMTGGGWVAILRKG